VERMTRQEALALVAIILAALGVLVGMAALVR
jgi:hypothetical protein